ncbi:10067_t:CDS:2 [Ambispora leptoticha]|uniref:10067_t:CDS:1 n=1 Tax=Ambispora leptoticha TaxID=144679 RepID=A0A9N9H5X0_9GLOM|nr:10067_t:CDS:2 [Ambispora leptoticha]
MNGIFNSKNNQTTTPLPSIQRVFLRSVAAEDPEGRFTIVRNIQTYYKPLADTTGLPVVAYDRPAFGFTERLTTWEENNNPYTQQSCLDFLIELLRNIGYGDRKVVIMGTSSGGAIASALAIKYPGYVLAIVLLCPALRPEDQGPPPLARHILTSLPGRLFLKAALYQYIPLTSLYHNAETIPQWETVIRPAYRVPLTLPNFYESVNNVMRYFVPLEILENRQALLRNTPILYITGNNDKYTSEEIHRQIAADMTSNMPEGAVFEFHVLPDCGHIPQDEKPREVFELTLDFLKRMGVYQPRIC